MTPLNKYLEGAAPSNIAVGEIVCDLEHGSYNALLAIYVHSNFAPVRVMPQPLPFSLLILQVPSAAAMTEIPSSPILFSQM